MWMMDMDVFIGLPGWERFGQCVFNADIDRIRLLGSGFGGFSGFRRGQWEIVGGDLANASSFYRYCCWLRWLCCRSCCSWFCRAIIGGDPFSVPLASALALAPIFPAIIAGAILLWVLGCAAPEVGKHLGPSSANRTMSGWLAAGGVLHCRRFSGGVGAGGRGRLLFDSSQLRLAFSRCPADEGQFQSSSLISRV